MTKFAIALCAFSGVLVVRGAALAAVCVEVDTSRDTLSEGERNAARILLAQALEREGVPVDPRGCTATYAVHHVKLGNSITVFLQGPEGGVRSGPQAGSEGYRQATVRAIEELPAMYSQLVRSLVTGQPMSTISDVVDRTNATSAQQAPNRVEADSLWYVRLGYGGVLGPDVGHGPAFGFGYRYELDALAVDLSFLNFSIGSNSNGNSGSAAVSGSWIKLMALYFLNPSANRSSYFGGGLGWGSTAVARSSATATTSGTTTYSTYTGSGLQAELSLGYELLRASTIRMFVQADATLPFYKVRSDFFDSFNGASTTSNAYAPSLAISFGIGWGRSTTRVHVVN